MVAVSPNTFRVGRWLTAGYGGKAPADAITDPRPGYEGQYITDPRPGYEGEYVTEPEGYSA